MKAEVVTAVQTAVTGETNDDSRERAGSSPGGDATAASTSEASLDAILDVLSNERRREVCRCVASEDPSSTLRELSECLAARENDVPVAELSSAERKRAYVALYQIHLPKMDDAGVIDFDTDRKTVRAGAMFPETYESLLAIQDRIESAGDDSGGGSHLPSSVTTLLSALRSRVSALRSPPR